MASDPSRSSFAMALIGFVTGGRLDDLGRLECSWLGQALWAMHSLTFEREILDERSDWAQAIPSIARAARRLSPLMAPCHVRLGDVRFVGARVSLDRAAGVPHSLNGGWLSGALWTQRKAVPPFCGTPEGTRTPDRRVRNPLLYPAELRARTPEPMTSD